MNSVILPELPTYLFAPTLGGLLSLILTVLLPLGAALLMRQEWSTTAKGLTLLALAAVKAFVEGWIGAVEADVTINLVELTYTVVVNFGIAVAAYFGLLRGTAVQRAAIEGGIVKSRTSDGTVV